MVTAPRGVDGFGSVFIRNNFFVNGASSNIISVSDKVVIKAGSQVSILQNLTSPIVGQRGGTLDLHVGEYSNITIDAPTTVLVPNAANRSGNQGVITFADNINIHSNSSLTINAVGTTAFPTLTNLSDSPMNIYVYNLATLIISSVRNGVAPVVSSVGSQPLSIMGNPRSKEFITNNSSTAPTVDFDNNYSKINLNNPADFNIQNLSDGNPAIISTNPTEPFIELYNTNIGVWQSGISNAGLPTAPSPFRNANLIGSTGGLLPGSSPEINDIPILTVPTLTQVPLGISFDPMTGVSAIDTEDGVLTNKIIVTGTVDVNTVGVYPISYSVTDSDGNTANAIQVVVVADDQMVIGNDTIIEATDFTKRLGQVNVTDASLLAVANVNVYDKQTGVLIPDAVVNVNKGSYDAVVGVYPITFTVDTDKCSGI